MTTYRPQVAVVTGATRGAGKGIAIGLGQQGMTVYVTGRAPGKSGARLMGQALEGTVENTAALVTAAGGKGIPVICDSANDADLAALFARVEKESGRLDILVNNATFVHEQLIEVGPFWEKPLELVKIIDVGLRSAYVASYYAAPLMVRRRRGLITFSSSFGGSCYMHGAAYGAQKAGIDKLAADMAVDLEPFNVAAISLWLGPQITERTEIAAKLKPEQYTAFLAQGETPQFNGRVTYALASDPEVMKYSGQTLITAEIATKYGVTEAGGRQPPSYREMLGSPRMPHPAKVI
jgi:NAD(P)-dependent dehydrogenase (short-subunit alcohol dehydrogenase family)